MKLINQCLAVGLLITVAPQVAASQSITGQNRSTTQVQQTDGSLKDTIALCESCHGKQGHSKDDLTPNLAGQKAAYLAKQLNEFKEGKRINPTMQSIAGSLGHSDVQKLADYFAIQPMRSIQAIQPMQPKERLSHSESAKEGQSGVALDNVSNLKHITQYFPETVFTSLKQANQIQRLPDLSRHAGGPNMLYTALTPDGKRLLSTSPSANQLFVFDALSGEIIATIAVGKAPKGVKVTPDGRLAYVSNQGASSISVIDMANLKLVDTIELPKAPHNVRFTGDGSLAYVTLQGGTGLGVIDTASRRLIKIINTPGITGPHNLDLSKDEKTAYVRDFVKHVAVVDLPTETVTKVITVGVGHGGIDVAPNNEYVVTASIGDSMVTFIDPKTLKSEAVEVGQGPHGVRASADSHWVYVTITGENKIAVLNGQTRQLVAKIPTGEFPFWLATKGNP